MSNIKFDFNKKSLVVTGGASGIGRCITEKFLQAQAQVTVWDYSETALSEAEKHFMSYSSQLQLAQVDVSSMASCQAAAEALSSPVDFLINNAGITKDKSFNKMSPEDFESVINTNLNSLFYVTKALMPFFTEVPKGKRIVNMSSIVALYGNFGQTNYVAAKAGVVGLTKTWAREFGRKGFTVNAIAPGFTRTSMVEKVPEDILKGIADKVPLARLGEVEDIANTCLFLCSEEASYINGTVMSVDGGLVL